MLHFGSSTDRTLFWFNLNYFFSVEVKKPSKFLPLVEQRFHAHFRYFFKMKDDDLNTIHKAKEGGSEATYPRKTHSLPCR